jgi:hypothetical protein
MSRKFEEVILPLLNNSKLMLRRLLSRDEAREKIEQLKISRKYLKIASEIELYRLTKEQVIPELERQIIGCGKIPDWHFGTLSFLQNLKETISEYKIENNQIISPQQKSTKAIFELIQLIDLSSKGDVKNLQQRMTNCLNIVEKYGNSEQLAKLQQILKDKNICEKTYIKSFFERFRLKYYNTLHAGQ